MNKNILIIGQGAIGQALALSLAGRNDTKITTVARTPRSYPTDSISFWQTDATTLTQDELASFSHIVIIVAPNRQAVMTDSVQAYRSCYLRIAECLASLANQLPSLERLIFVSSTSVYGENEGQVIDIHTPVKPVSDTAKILYQAETVLQTAFKHKCVIVRPSGIYGVTRLALVNLAKTSPKVAVQAWTNRIMDSDLVQVLGRIVILEQCEPVYLATDCCPVPRDKVLAFIADQLYCPLPICQNASPTGKQIIGNLPKDWLTFSDYRQGYGYIIGRIQGVKNKN